VLPYGGPIPEPLVKLNTALVWAWAEVEAWARTTGRLYQSEWTCRCSGAHPYELIPR